MDQSDADRKLIDAVRRGEDGSFEELTEKYRPLLTRMVSTYYDRYREYDAEWDDLNQEATLALYRAAKTYDTEQNGVTLGLYARVCIRNRLTSAGRKYLKEAKAKERGTAQSTGAQAEPHRLDRPETMTDEVLACLSPYERRVLRMVAGGSSCGDIARLLGKDRKSVENAVYRSRRKLAKRI